MGGGNRKDDLVISNTNVFAALGTLRKKKKSDKDGKNKSSSGGSSSAHKQERKEAEPLVFWAPAPLTAKSWADVDDEDDDDYYATTAPPQSVWAGSGGEAEHKPQPKESSTPVEVGNLMVSRFYLNLYTSEIFCVVYFINECLIFL